MKYTANQYAENTIINITLNDQNQKIITFLGYGWRTDADDNDPHPYRFSHYGNFAENINTVLSDGIRKYEGRESEFVQQYIDEYSAQELVEVYETYDNGNMPKIIKTNQLTENTPCGTYIVDMTNALENKTYKNKIKGIYKKIERIKTEIEELYDKEQTALNSMPENFENTECYAIADNAVDNLASAILKLEETLEYLEKARTRTKSSQSDTTI